MQVARTPDERFEALPDFHLHLTMSRLTTVREVAFGSITLTRGHEMGIRCCSFTENHRGASFIATSSRNLSMEDAE